MDVRWHTNSSVRLKGQLGPERDVVGRAGAASCLLSACLESNRCTSLLALDPMLHN